MRLSVIVSTNLPLTYSIDICLKNRQKQFDWENFGRMEWFWNGFGMNKWLIYKDSSIIPLFIIKKSKKYKFETSSCFHFVAPYRKNFGRMEESL